MTIADRFRSPVGAEWGYPSAYPSPWYVSNGYLNGYWLSPYNGRSTWAIHTGDDILIQGSADEYAPVYAIGNGVVTSSKVEAGSWGYVIVIRHTLPDGSTIYSRYGHVANATAKRGDEVVIAQHIADCGNANGKFAFHLHFDISHTKILASNPAHWPAATEAAVKRDYLDPSDFLLANRGQRPPLTEWEKFQQAIQRLPASKPVVVSMDGEIYDLKVGDFWQSTVYRVTADILNIRAEPSTNATILGTFSLGAQVSILEQRNGWGKTDRGWISLAYAKAG